MAAFGHDYDFLAKRHLYVAAGQGGCKIGVSKKPKERISGLSSAQARDVELIKSWPKQGHLEPIAHEVNAATLGSIGNSFAGIRHPFALLGITSAP
jgi:hypothetical protein